MELKESIERILDREAVVIMGAGASFGAQNMTGPLPSGKKMAKSLYEKCTITPDDISDLGDASRVFIKQHSKIELIEEIRKQLNCIYVSDSHITINALPWMRYYTTNYDNVPIISAEKAGKSIIPATLSMDCNKFIDRPNVCVYINGHIDRLNENTLDDEFKLTSTSYQSAESIINNPWSECLRQDLDAAKSIFIIGLSLNYDLDLRRILYKAEYRKKTIIITSPTATENEIDKLEEFGRVYAIGIDNFAVEVKTVQSKHPPRTITSIDRIYECFEHDFKRKYISSKAKPDSVFDLIRYGQVDDTLFSRLTSKTGKERLSGIVNRSKVANIKQDILNKKKAIFVCSELGNGKTTCLAIVRYALALENIHIFTLVNPDSPKLAEEIVSIREIARDCPVLVIIDDYTHYYEVVRKFSIGYNGSVQFIFSARTALNNSNMPGVISDFHFGPGESVVCDINSLDKNEISDCISLFDRFGLFGEYAGLSVSDKFSRLTVNKAGASKFQNIVIDLFSSKARGITNKLDEIIKTISTESDKYNTAVILLLLRNVMNLRLSVRDIECISQIDITTDATFRANPAISELISYTNNGQIKIKSPVTAKYILQRVANAETIISALVKVAEYSEKYASIEKFQTLLKSITSCSLIISFVQGFKQYDTFLLNYFDELSRISYYANNSFFWLQYAMACIEAHRYDRAEQYLDVALSMSGETFVPFQINNQKARLCLIRIVNHCSDDPYEDFLAAHSLLMIPITSPRDDEYNVIWAFRYYKCKEIQQAMRTPEQIETYCNACREALNRTQEYIKKYPEQQQRLDQLTKGLLSASFYR